MSFSRPPHSSVTQHAVLTFAFWLFLAATVQAQEVPVPVALHFPILLKTLSFDRNLKTRCEKGIVIGVLYQRRFRRSLDIKDELVSIADELASPSVEGLPVQVVPLEYLDLTALQEEVSAHGINTIYVTPLRAVDIAAISALTKTNRILTLTGVSEYVESGISIGVTNKGGRPSLVINLRASRQEGADLDSQLLDLARTIK